MAARRFPKPKPHGTDEVEADVYYDFIAPDPSPSRLSFEEPAGRARAPRSQARARSHASRHAQHYQDPARPDYPYAAGSSSDDERPADPRPSRRAHAQPPEAAPAARGARAAAAPRARVRVESPSPRGNPDPRGASVPRARKSACATTASAASAAAPAASKGQAAPAAAAAKKLHFSTAPTSPTAPWTPRVAGFNKRTFCAAVGRVAATHARRAALQLWELSNPRNDEELNDLLGATNIRIIVSEGLNLVPRANELISPEVAQEVDAAVRGRATGARAAARSASRRRPPE
ncbi:tegument protein VP22 [Macacine alphaherpesvirus 1]|uniref:Tegument protein VP22 n=1 Tax=Macacine alphaherpesvirus 2 TaxID=2845554 RepID=A0A1X9WFI1_9ALPH|nr:tegument protein VP22 [Macacine alphaherpesvirus 1]ARS01686.1 tegument protein VP22 [Macacine alphaherpesvirus 2]